MFYEVKFSPEELEILQGFIGKSLALVAADGWACGLRISDKFVNVIPEEFSTPDKEHAHGEVERPLIKLGMESILPKTMTILGECLGVVRAVNVISILVTFSPVVICPATELMPGVVLPEGPGYGWMYHPSQREATEKEVGNDRAIVDLDVAFELITERISSLVIYTQGYFVHVSLGGLPTDVDWVQFGYFLRRAV